MPAAAEAVGAPGGGGGGGGDVVEAYEIRNDQGFVYKVARGLYSDAAPSTTQSAAGPDRKAAGLRRRCRALLRLRDKRRRDLSRWEALASELLLPLPAPQPPASAPVAAADFSSAPDAAAFSSSPPVAAAASSSTSILDDLIVQVDLQRELMKKARQWCDEANAVCDAQEAAFFESIAPLQLWGRNPLELMAGLCSPAASSGNNLDEQNGCPEASGVSSAAAEKTPLPLRSHNPLELMAGLCSPAASVDMNEQNECPEASGVSSAAAKKIENSINKQKTGSRLRQRVTNVAGSDNVAPQASIEQKRKKASWSTTTAPGTTPVSTRSKAKFTLARAPFIVGSPGALTRRRAGAKNESPGGS